MDFMTAAKTGFGKLSDFDGRATRSEYWWYVLAVFLVLIAGNIVLTVILGGLGAFVASLVGIGLMIAASVRRLRDAGKPEMLAYVYFGLSFLYYLMASFGILLGMLMSVVGLVTLVVALIMLYFLVQPTAGGASETAAAS